MHKNLYFYKTSKKIQYDTDNGPITIRKNNSSKNNNFMLENEVVKTYDLKGVLGVIETEEGKYFVFVTEADEFEQNKIKTWKINKVKYLCLEGESSPEILEAVKNFIESHSFYMTEEEIKECYRWNGAMQENVNKLKLETFKGNKQTNRSPFLFAGKIEKNENERKNNNENLCSLKSKLIYNLFCGYFEMQHLRNGNDMFTFIIKSYISTNKIGPRMLCRGVDQEGNVSFFVKTYFSIEAKNGQDIDKHEFTCFRGSVPLLWSQNDPLKPSKIWFDGTEEENIEAFNKHLKKIVDEDEKLIVIDLLSHHKYEAILSQMYRDKCKENKIKYINFNLNAHVNDYETMKSILYDKLDRVGEEDSEESSKSEEIVEEEEDLQRRLSIDTFISDTEYVDTNVNLVKKVNRKHLFRINCLDCLDRTNLCQFLLFNYYNPYKFVLIKNMWKNNGDALAMLYTGSQALKGDFAKEKKMSIMNRLNDALISANRMLNNKFTDKDKQRVIDVILHKNNS